MSLLLALHGEPSSHCALWPVARRRGSDLPRPAVASPRFAPSPAGANLRDVHCSRVIPASLSRLSIATDRYSWNRRNAFLPHHGPRASSELGRSAPNSASLPSSSAISAPSPTDTTDPSVARQESGPRYPRTVARPTPTHTVERDALTVWRSPESPWDPARVHPVRQTRQPRPRRVGMPAVSSPNPRA